MSKLQPMLPKSIVLEIQSIWGLLIEDNLLVFILEKKEYSEATMAATPLDTYKRLIQIPNVCSGYISFISDTPRLIVVNSIWQQRDLARNDYIKFSRTFTMFVDDVWTKSKLLASHPEEINEICRSVSMSGKFTAILRRTASSKRSGSDDAIRSADFIDVYDNIRGHKVASFRLKDFEQHGKVHSTLSNLIWSCDDKKILYLAERTGGTVGYSQHHYKGLGNEECDEYLENENWGEQMTDVRQPVVCLLHIEKGELYVVKELANFTPLEPLWTPDETGILFIKVKDRPRKLGMLYCFNRAGQLTFYDLQTQMVTHITEATHAIASLRFSPDRSRLIYLRCGAGGPHRKAAQLILCDWVTMKTSVIVDTVYECDPDKQFPGLYVIDIPRRCWSEDSSRILLNAHWASKAEILVIHLTRKTVARLRTTTERDESWHVLDVYKDFVLAYYSLPNAPPRLAIARLPLPGDEARVIWFKFVEADGSLQYEGIYLKPADKSKSPYPLILWPHGGPHSTYTTAYSFMAAFFVSVGFAVLRVNYRGSLGFGEKFVNCLGGLIGTTDVLDCHHAVATVLQCDSHVNKKAILLFGGSHGGFIALHLIGQYTCCYTSCVALNPVTNLSAMYDCSDIPDWCIYEALLENVNFSRHLSLIQREELWSKSPIRYVNHVTTPTMFLLGTCDMRVPMSQTREYINNLKARCTLVRVLMYPENNHPIDRVDAECDYILNTVAWFEKCIQIAR
ncbi:Acylamino-acid-releasing enzyme [Trichinella spiralis]|uniref:acylaminoacyl-peptidase n=1 Tax=Trichinella spiralis TaxID=6334 RepID=A0A0V1B7C3_TRISP|nr:Acylamino-acid-releasing enzyme [Trichinella spiralis]